MKTETNPNDPAMPVVETAEVHQSVSTGLTKREHFAAMAMQGILSNPDYMAFFDGGKYLQKSDVVAQVSIDYADALIAELNKTER